MKKKLIAFYLPQFHEIPENNEWWGEGFTEWTSVKAAKPLFPGHQQPTSPYKQNYYNLLDVDVLHWQAKIAQKAGVYGFCFYHYWFKGKKLLEKPIELFLSNPTIRQHFCLSWANESWIRTWSNMEGNDWNETLDKKMKKEGPKILMKQDYGTEQDWDEHFYYLLPFFQDKRYIKVQGKPLFIFYKPAKIKCLKEMLMRWNALAKERGLPGIWAVSTNDTDIRNPYLDACIMYEPAYTFSNDMPPLYSGRNKARDYLKERGMEFPILYNYDLIWHRILKREIHSSLPVYRGGFVNFDDTPRRGKNGSLFLGRNSHKFGCYLKKLLTKTNEEFVFLTAWNEWAEGAYLEPDERHGYAYLNEIRNCLKNE